MNSSEFDAKLDELLSPFSGEDRVGIVRTISSFGIEYRLKRKVETEWIENAVSGFSDEAQSAILNGMGAWIEYQLTPEVSDPAFGNFRSD